MIRFLYLLIALFLIGTNLCAQKNIKVERLGTGINTNFDEVAPVVSIDGQTLYFTRLGYYDFERTLIEEEGDLSSMKSAQEYERYLGQIYSTIAGRHVSNPFASPYNQDIWIAESDDKVHFDRISHPGYPLNNALPNSIGSLTPSGNEVILINQFIADGGMKKGFSLSRQDESGAWSFPEDIIVNNYHNSGPDVSMCMSADGSVMILSLEKRDGYGRSDLYLCLRMDNNSWTTPINLGRMVNSSARETTPFLSEDKRMLFFSSSRSGNNDIFMSRRRGDDWFDWTKPSRYKSPINSKSDDSQPYFNAETGFLYFTSKRSGSSDIYRAKIAGPNPYFITLKGKILNSKTGEPVSGTVKSNFQGRNYDNLYVSSNGDYQLKIPKGINLSITSEKTGFTGRTEEVSFPANYVFFKDFEMDLFVDPLEVGSEIVLDPIFFKQSKSIVREESYPAMDKLGNFLKTHPEIRIMIKGHTDNQGPKESLQKLSKERALAIKNHLILRNGIHPIRIKTMGLGPAEPIADNNIEEGRMKNRRVEVSITEVDDVFTVGKEK